MNISKRAMKCLKRIDAGKSIPDIGAMDELENKGLITCTYGDGECEILITEAGKSAIASTPTNGEKNERN